MNPTPRVSSLQADVDDSTFYYNSEDVINNEISNINKSISITRNSRINAAEIEVETAALHLNIHWSKLEEFKQLLEQKPEFYVSLKQLLASLK